MLRRRETMIALKARHEAFRVANEVAHPHLDVPPPRELRSGPPISRATPVQWVVYQPIEDEPPMPQSAFIRLLMHDVVLSLIGIAAGFGVILLCKYG